MGMGECRETFTGKRGKYLNWERSKKRPAIWGRRSGGEKKRGR